MHTNVQAELAKAVYHFPSWPCTELCHCPPTLHLPTCSQVLPHSPAMGQGPSTHQDRSGCHSLHTGNSAWPRPPSSCHGTEDNMHESSPDGTWHPEDRHWHRSGWQKWPHALPLKCGQQIQGEKPCCALVHTKGTDCRHWLHLTAPGAGGDHRGIYQAQSTEAPGVKWEGEDNQPWC